MKNLEIPLLADTSKSLGEALVILEEEFKFSYRATYIVDPEGIIRLASVNELSVGRNVNEVLRDLDALQTGGLTTCNLQPGQDTL